MRNKNSNIQGMLQCDKNDFPYAKELLIQERIRSLWERILPLREVPILKRDAIEENQCLIQ